MMNVQGFNHLTLNVRDLNQTLLFYTEILGMSLRHKGRKDAYLEWGQAWMCIIENPDFEERKKAQLGFDHIAFYIAEEHFDESVNLLKDNKIQIVRGPIERGGGWSLNFLDPNGIQFELHTSTLEERMRVWK